MGDKEVREREQRAIDRQQKAAALANRECWACDGCGKAKVSARKYGNYPCPICYGSGKRPKAGTDITLSPDRRDLT